MAGFRTEKLKGNEPQSVILDLNDWKHLLHQFEYSYEGLSVHPGDRNRVPRILFYLNNMIEQLELK